MSPIGGGLAGPNFTVDGHLGSIISAVIGTIAPTIAKPTNRDAYSRRDGPFDGRRIEPHDQARRIVHRTVNFSRDSRKEYPRSFRWPTLVSRLDHASRPSNIVQEADRTNCSP